MVISRASIMALWKEDGFLDVGTDAAKAILRLDRASEAAKVDVLAGAAAVLSCASQENSAFWTGQAADLAALAHSLPSVHAAAICMSRWSQLQGRFDNFDEANCFFLSFLDFTKEFNAAKKAVPTQCLMCT